MRTKRTPQNKFLRIITIPVRALCKARDFYIKSMTGYSKRMHYGSSSVIGAQVVGQVHGLPKSYSTNSARSNNNNEEYRELLRAASARNVGPSDLDSFIRQQMMMKSASARRSSRSQPVQPQPQPQPEAMPPRSKSVAMGRIDEDSPVCYFGNLDTGFNKSKVAVGGVKSDLKYTRSRSHSVTR